MFLSLERGWEDPEARDLLGRHSRDVQHPAHPESATAGGARSCRNCST